MCVRVLRALRRVLEGPPRPKQTRQPNGGMAQLDCIVTRNTSNSTMQQKQIVNADLGGSGGLELDQTPKLWDCPGLKMGHI